MQTCFESWVKFISKLLGAEVSSTKIVQPPNVYPGETQAITTLNSFLDSRFHRYYWKISRPWKTQNGAISHLFPHLTFGTISVRQVYQRTKKRAAELVGNPKAQFIKC